MLANHVYRCIEIVLAYVFVFVWCMSVFSLSLSLFSMKNDLFIVIFCPIHNSCRVYMNIVHRARAAPRNPKQTISMLYTLPPSSLPPVVPSIGRFFSVSHIYDIYTRERALNRYDEPTVIHFTTHTWFAWSFVFIFMFFFCLLQFPVRSTRICIFFFIWLCAALFSSCFSLLAWLVMLIRLRWLSYLSLSFLQTFFLIVLPLIRANPTKHMPIANSYSHSSSTYTMSS